MVDSTYDPAMCDLCEKRCGEKCLREAQDEYKMILIESEAQNKYQGMIKN